MKTDRELLELAAKAAGLHVKVSSNSGIGLKVHGNCNWWNPLIDDGDALRLAVKLSMAVDIYTARVEVRWYDDITSETFTVTEHDNNADNDLIAATRRAIVRAAAAIGEAMQ